MHPKISVIIPTYNVKPYLRQCLDSVVNQTLADIEIICVNDGSTDGSEEILREYAAKYKQVVLIDKENSGYGTSVNYGLAAAKGEYIGIIETDDFVDLSMYEKLYDHSQSEENVDIVKAPYWEYYDYPGTTPYRNLADLNQPPAEAFTVFEKPEILSMHPSIWSAIYKRTFLNSNRIRLIEAPGAAWVDNLFFIQTMYLARKILWLPDAHYHYRQTNPASSSHMKDCTIPFKRMLEIYDFTDRRQISDPEVLKFIYQRNIHYVKQAIENPNYIDVVVRPFIEITLARMDKNVVHERLAAADISIYKQFIRTDHTDKRSIEYKKLSARAERAERELYRIKASRSFRLARIITWLPRMLRATWRSLKENGLKYTLKRILSRLGLNPGLNHGSSYGSSHGSGYESDHGSSHGQKRRASQKNGLKVLFIASDNNRTSGAFLSMTVLNRLLNRDLGVSTCVILPNEGNGGALLKDHNISYQLIRSYDWIVPLDIVRDKDLEKEISRKAAENLKAAEEIARLVKEEHYDLIHINTTYSYVGALAAQKAGIPYVWHLREFLEEDQGKCIWNKEEGYQLIRQASKIIAISESIRQKYLPVFGEDKLTVIKNGIDADIFYKPQKEIFGKERAIFIFVGGFEEYKGQPEFTEACIKLFESGFRDFEIWFIGTGKIELRDYLLNKLSDHGLSDQVKYLGYQKNVAEYYEQADISFTCARAEAFGRTTVEAMLSGVLVIGANTAGTKELLEDGKTGLLYEQGKVDDLCQKMRYALENKDEMKKIAAHGRQTMVESMTAQINAQKIIAVYREILKI